MKKALLGRVGLALASTLLSLAAAEGVYRGISAQRGEETKSDDSWRQRLSRMNHTIYQRSADPRLVYEPRPSSHVDMPYGVAGFNAAGMRDDREHPRESTEPRLALLGDSLAWSEHLGLGDSLARRLEEATHRTVLSFGVSGYDTAQEAIWYERAVRPFHPRTVVLIYCLNDVLLMSGPYNVWATPDEARAKDAQDAFFERVAPLRAETLDQVAEREERQASWKSLARLRALLREQTYERSAAYTDELLVAYADAARVQRMRSALHTLGASLRADGARAHLVISPVLRAWDTYHWRGIHTLVADAGRDAGFTVHDPLDEFLRETRADALRLPGDSLHYGEAGTRTFADYVARRLGPPP